MRVAACQVPDIRNDVTAALLVIHEQSMCAQRRGADAVVFPECFLQGYFTDVPTVSSVAIEKDSPQFKEVLRFLRNLDVTVVVGFIERAGRHFYNAAVAIRRGEIVCHYRKTSLLEGEKVAFTPGAEYPTFEVAGERAGINICYDLNFDRAMHPLIEQGARVLLCPCNNMMPFEKAESYKQVH
ncbi:MAG: carbon-nitrogen hydrolase family protein, partial [Pseudomonadota bacterium]